MKRKSILSMLLSVVMLVSMLGVNAFAADGISVKVQKTAGGEQAAVQFTEETGTPFVDENSRTMIPLRAAGDAMGLTVDWEAETKEATFTRTTEAGDEFVSFKVDSDVYYVGSLEKGAKDATAIDKTMDTKTVVKDGRIYAPIRFLAEAFGYNVGWDGATKTVTVLADKAEQPAEGTKTENDYSQAKPLLLQGAMDIEMQDMVKALENAKTVDIDNYHFVRGTINGYPVVVSRTEQGIANAAVVTALAMQHFDPVAVINNGTSGGHDPELHTFDIVIGEKSVPSSAWRSKASKEGEGVDYKAIEMNGVYAYDKQKGEFTQAVAYPADATLVKTAQSVADTYTKGKVVTGTISTSDEWNNQVDRMLYLHELNGSSVEEMETNAVAQICKTYDVPFLGIRILSNTGIYGESFDPASGPACQEYVLNVAKAYIDGTLKKAAPVKAAAPISIDYKSDKRPILLQGAMDIEMQDMAKALKDSKEIKIGEYLFVTGTLDGYPVVVSRTEQGLANAGVVTALAMEYFKPAAVINNGTSGGHDPELHTFDIVIGEKSVPSSAWKSKASKEGEGVDYKAIEMNGVYAYDKQKGGFTQAVEYPGDAKLIAAAEAVKDTYTKGKVVKGTISSSDEWNNQVDRMLYLHELNGSSVEEMETNAVAQICKTYDVPFLGIRILSNTGIYGESFDPASGPACQEYVLNVAREYIKTL